MNQQDLFPEFVEDEREFLDRLVTPEWETYRTAAWAATRGREVVAIMRHVSPRRIVLWRPAT